MTARLMQFASSFAVIALIAVMAVVYVRCAVRRWFPKEKIDSIEWVKENRSKLMWRLSAPLLYIQAPTLEELIFRGPLLLLFVSLSSQAWIGIAVSAVLFGIAHWFGPKILFSEVEALKKIGELSVAAKEMEAEQPKLVLLRRILHVVFATILGLIAGYLTIKCQSLWAGVLVHMVWNIVMPILLPILLMVVALAIVWLGGIISDIIWYFQCRKMRKDSSKALRDSVSFGCGGGYRYDPNYRPELDEGVPLESEDDQGPVKKPKGDEGGSL